MTNYALRLRLRKGLVLFAALVGALCSLGLAARTSAVFFDNPDGSRSPVVQLEIARTAGEHAVGLMYRKHLSEDAGMLFVFDDESPRSFWMKNTYIELDMIFVNARGRVVCVTRRTPPLTEKPRRCPKPAQYVVEVGGGLTEKWGVVEGSTMVRDS